MTGLSTPHTVSASAATQSATCGSIAQRLRSAAMAIGCAAVAAVVMGTAALTAPLTHAQTTPAATAPAATPAATPAAAPAPLMASKGATAHVENPYGLKAMWQDGDMVTKTTFFLLVIMSLGTWYIIVTKLFEIGKIGRQAKAAEDGFWKAPTIAQGAESLKEESPFRFIAQAGIEATKKHEGLLAHIGFSDWVTMSMQRATDAVQSRLQDGLAFLATVGSTAPFVGLFGTVWGIYNALVKIGVSGQASIDKVAGPVGEALIMTAIGLAVAVPAVLGYNFIVRRNKTTMDRIRNFGSDLHSVLLGSHNAKATK